MNDLQESEGPGRVGVKKRMNDERLTNNRLTIYDWRRDGARGDELRTVNDEGMRIKLKLKAKGK